MSLFDLFRSKRSSASIAKERLQIIISHERQSEKRGPDYLPLLRQELIAVIARYVNINEQQITVQLEREDNCSILELNITLPDMPE